jgi:hypothetical protein
MTNLINKTFPIPRTLSKEVEADILGFLTICLPEWLADECKDADCEYCLELTVAVDECGTHWNYQTGDNSYSGGAYGLPHWATFTVTDECTVAYVYESIRDQLNDLLAQ